MLHERLSFARVKLKCREEVSNIKSIMLKDLSGSCNLDLKIHDFQGLFWLWKPHLLPGIRVNTKLIHSDRQIELYLDQIAF